MNEYRLNVAQGGFAAGVAKLLAVDNEICEDVESNTSAVNAEEEQNALDAAVESLKSELSDYCEGGVASRAIMDAELLLLDDENFIPRAKRIIEEARCTAQDALRKTSNALEEMLDASESEYIRGRASDVRGLAARLIHVLSGEEAIQLSEPAILVADELSPAAISALDSSMIRGFVSKTGSSTSHVFIIAGELGVPYLHGCDELLQDIRDGDRLVIDGDKVVRNPQDRDWEIALGEYATRQAQIREESGKRLREIIDVETKMRVCANIGNADNLEALKSCGADGVGLFRSEFLFLGSDEAPSEEEQYVKYRAVAEAMGEKETVIRTMDIGSDKNARWLEIDEEKNPALGCRGVRVSLEYPALFKTQLRALMRAAVFGNVKMLVPMVVSTWEVDAVRRYLEECASELAEEGVEYKMPSLGIMIETPAAAILAADFASKVDFFSIGTNDLAQYCLAIDREAKNLGRYFDPCHESVFALLDIAVQAAHRANIPVCVCGEIAGDPKAIERFAEMGVDKLSVSVARVIDTKARVIEVEKALAEKNAKNEDDFSIFAPADGDLVSMEEIPDPAFSSGMLGQCIGIMPSEGKIYAPCDGEISSIADALHALTFTDSAGRTILVHVGLDTVTLKGVGFKPLVAKGEKVRAGQNVMDFDLDAIVKAGLSPIVVAVLCNE